LEIELLDVVVADRKQLITFNALERKSPLVIRRNQPDLADDLTSTQRVLKFSTFAVQPEPSPAIRPSRSCSAGLSRFALVVNMKAATQLGVYPPLDLIKIADLL
jgi:hypothetical protein